MAKVKLDIGANIDFLNKDELSDALDADRQRAAAYDRDTYRGIKYFRLPYQVATVTSSTIKFGTAGSEHIAPDSGYIWMITRLFCYGLTAGTVPDVLGIYRGGADNVINEVWQLTGNAPGQTFSKFSLVYLAGEYLQAKNVGTLAATGQLILTGEAVQVPQEMLGKLV